MYFCSKYDIYLLCQSITYLSVSLVKISAQTVEVLLSNYVNIVQNEYENI
jgi:hypothetical protein